MKLTVDQARQALTEGNRAGVSSNKPAALHQRLQGGISNDTNKIVKCQALSEKRKAQDDPSGAASSEDQINGLIDRYQAGRSAEAEPLAVSLLLMFRSLSVRCPRLF